MARQRTRSGMWSKGDAARSASTALWPRRESWARTTSHAARGARGIELEAELDALVARQVDGQRPAVVHALLHARHVGLHLGARHAVVARDAARAGAVAAAAAAQVAGADGPVHLGARARSCAPCTSRPETMPSLTEEPVPRARASAMPTVVARRDLPRAGLDADRRHVLDRAAHRGRHALDGDRLRDDRRDALVGARLLHHDRRRARDLGRRLHRGDRLHLDLLGDHRGRALLRSRPGSRSAGATAIAAGSKTAEARSATTRGRAAGSSFATRPARAAARSAARSPRRAPARRRAAAPPSRPPWSASETPLESTRARRLVLASRSEARGRRRRGRRRRGRRVERVAQRGARAAAISRRGRRRITSSAVRAVAMALAPRAAGPGSPTARARLDARRAAAVPHARTQLRGNSAPDRRCSPASIRSYGVFCLGGPMLREPDSGVNELVQRATHLCPARAIRVSSGLFTLGDIHWTRNEILDLLRQGWLTTVPLGLLSVIVFTIALERAWRYRGLEKATRDLARKQVDALVRRDVATARALCETSKHADRARLRRGAALAQHRARGPERGAEHRAPGGARGAAARALVHRHDRLAGAVHRPLRHRGRHHALVPRDRRHRRHAASTSWPPASPRR